jgi:hypothetical protein
MRLRVRTPALGGSLEGTLGTAVGRLIGECTVALLLKLWRGSRHRRATGVGR